MNPKQIKPVLDQEFRIQAEIIAFLSARGWFVKETHGNMFQSGFPDLFATHTQYGQRWIEVKRPYPNYSFTPAQLDNFPKFCAFGCGIWILTAGNEDEYQKLFKPHNWYYYFMQLGAKGVDFLDKDTRSVSEMLKRI